MSNLCILLKNLTDTTSTLIASNTAGTLTANNLKTDFKSQVHRSTGNSVTYTLTWNTPQKIGCVILPCTNLSQTSTIRIRMYSDVNLTTLVKDSGVELAANVPTSLEWNTLNVNTFNYGGYSKVSKFFTTQTSNVKSLTIDLIDTNNSVGYIDCSRILCGEYWSPKYNFEKGVSWSWNDNSTTERTISGDYVSNRGYAFEKLSFTFSILPETSRNELLRIIKYYGTNKNVLISLVPFNDWNDLSSSYLIYGRISPSSLSEDFYKFYSTSLTVEGW